MGEEPATESKERQWEPTGTTAYNSAGGTGVRATAAEGDTTAAGSPSRGPRVFCSHDARDKPRVEPVARCLAEAGIDPWLDAWEIQVGDSIVESIERGLETYDVGLVFLSATTLERPWVRRELSVMILQWLEDGRPLIPVLLDPGVPLPTLIRDLAWIPAEETGRLTDAVYGRSNKPRVAPARPVTQVRRFTIQAWEASNGDAPTAPDRLEVRAWLDGEPLGPTASGPAGLDLRLSYREFLEARVPAARRISSRDAAAQRDRALARLGDALSLALLPDPFGEALDNLLAGAGTRTEVLLELESPSPRLLALPFEALRRPNGTLPALVPNVRMTRRPVRMAGAAQHPEVRAPEPLSDPSGPPSDPLAASAASLEPIPGPLKVLVAVGAPDEGVGRGVVLDSERELHTILGAAARARAEGQVEVRILEVGHPDEIARALLRDPYHVLHISCHGAAGYLQLEDELGAPVTVTPRDLAGALQSARRTVPLVFLAACHTGAGDSRTVSFAQDLLEQGVPQVLAMQGSVSDWYATWLAGAFYAHLAAAEAPLASHALASARQEIERQRRRAVGRGDASGGLLAEYATPALFSVPDERPLVDRAGVQEPLAPRPAPPTIAGIPWLEVDELIGRRDLIRRALRVLRGTDRLDPALERRSGASLVGMGGVGKSAIAGRIMSMLAGEGWYVAAAVAQWNLTELALCVGDQLAGLDPFPDDRSRAERDARLEVRQLGQLLTDPELEER